MAKKSVQPFFSIVVPCYNDGRYAEGVYLDRLLNSLLDQGIQKDELEVILADDCSPVPFDDVVKKYSKKLNIKRIKTDYNFAPGNTREKGMSLVTGKWVAFADHDDIYYPSSLIQIQNLIKEKNEDLFCFASFHGVTPEGKVIKEYNATLNWCHAKFYNVENLWRKHDVHFPKDLKSHEDIAICTQVSCILHQEGRTQVTYLPHPIYAWTDNPKSVSHSKYTVEGEQDPRYFLEVFFRDYIQSTGDFYIEKFQKHEIKYPFAITNAIETLLYCYFYTQGFQFRRPEDFLEINLVYSGEFLDKIRTTFNVTKDQIYEFAAANNASKYLKIRKFADAGSGPYIPQQTFKQWLKLVEEMFLNSL